MVVESAGQGNVKSCEPSALMQIGDWSTPMNVVPLLSTAAVPVAPARLKPTVTITSYFWSMNDLIDGP